MQGSTLMYGMVNRAIEDLVVDSAGEEVWQKIKQDAEVEFTEFFDSSQYSDEITYRLVEAASGILKKSTESILHDFGRHWILYTGREGWDSVFALGGDNMIDYIKGLDSMHSRVQSALPEACMPQFGVEERSEHFRLTYRSSREGLAPMVLGMLDGLAERFDEPWLIQHMKSDSAAGCEFFELRLADSWTQRHYEDAA